MSHIKLIYSVIICILGLLVSGCWFDFTSEDWELEPQYVALEPVSFGEDSNSHIRYIQNNGSHSQISFSISTSDKWIVPSITSGSVAKDEDQKIEININRTFLPEGNNEGKLIVMIDNYPYDIPVTAIGFNRIETKPNNLNFGSNDDVTNFTIRSYSGTREIEITPGSDWLLVSDDNFTLPEYDPNKSETERKITVKCKRSLLTDGDHTSSVEIVSGLGDKLLSIPVLVTIPPINSQTVALDNYVFFIAKHLYWDDNNVVLELGIKNHKYLKSFELIGPNSYALGDDNNKYSLVSTSVVIQPNSEGIMIINIQNVDKSVKSFSDIVLSIRYLSERIVFHNVELQ